jgi:carboxypeptidase family protein
MRSVVRLAICLLLALIVGVAIFKDGSGESAGTPHRGQAGVTKERSRLREVAPALSSVPVERQSDRIEPDSPKLRLVAPDGRPIAECPVRIVGADGRKSSATSDMDGIVQPRLPAQSGWFRVELPDGRRSNWVRFGPPVPTSSRTLIVAQGVALGGRVIDGATRRPIAGVAVLVSERGPETGSPDPPGALPPTESTSNEQGAFGPVQVTRGAAVTVTAQAAGYGRVDRVVVVPAEGDMPPTEIELFPGGSVTGAVRAPAMELPSGIRVAVVPGDRKDMLESLERGLVPPGVANASVSEDGAFRVEQVALGGAYLVFATADGGWSSVDPIPVALTQDAPSAHVEVVLRPPAQIEALVLDHSDRPVARAEVELVERIGIFMARRTFVESREPGRYRIEGVTRGPAKIEVRIDDRVVGRLKVDVKQGDIQEVVVQIETPAWIRGSVVDDRGAAVAHARVSVRCEDEDEVDSRLVETGADGLFEAADLLPGRYRITASAPSFSLVNASGATAMCEAPASGVMLRLTRSAAVRLRLRLPTGSPPPRTIAFVTPCNSGSLAWSDAEIVFHDLPIGDGSIHLYPSGYAPLELRFVAAPGATIDLGEWTLDEGAELVGRVVDLAKQPVPGATVMLWTTGSADSPSTITREDGSFVLQHLSRSDNEILVHKDGFLDSRTRWNARAESPATDVVLSRGAMIHVSVVDGVARPVAGRLVRLTPIRHSELSDSGSQTATTDYRGECSYRVPAGQYSIVVAEGTREDLSASEGEVREVKLRIP